MAQVAEYFTLREASTAASRIPEHARKDIAHALAVGRQKAEAAEALWSNGHTAEGLRLAVEGLHATLEAAPLYARATAPVRASAEASAAEEAAAAGAAAEESVTEGSSARDETESDSDPAREARWRPVLEARGLSADRSRAIADAEQKARTTALPRLDAEVGATHAELYQQIARARLEVERALAHAAMTQRELGWTRAARIATAAFVALVVIGGVVFATRAPREIDAEASATFANSPTFGAGNAVDGDVGTEWLLPDGATGWVEARLSPPRHVASVTLQNAKNAPHFDRATRAYRLEIYSGDRVVRSIDGEFSTYERDPRPVSHEVGADEVDRVRFIVRSHHNLGAGLAELGIEE